jgi:WD40 repeat protein
VRLWDVATGREFYRLYGHGELGSQRCLGFAPDGQRFFSWGDDDYLRTWDVATGKALAEHDLQPGGQGTPDEDLDDRELKRQHRRPMAGDRGVFSPDGKWFALSLGSRAHLFDVATGREVRAFAHAGGFSMGLAISPDSRYLLSSDHAKGRSADGIVCLWELARGSLLRQITIPDSFMGPITFSSDGKFFAVATQLDYIVRLTTPQPDAQIRLFEVASGKQIRSITGLPVGVSSLACSLDGKELIAAMEDTSILIWDLAKLFQDPSPR